MNNISDVRTTAAELIAAIRKKELTPEEGRVCRDLLQTVVDTAKVEVEFCRTTKSGGSGFIGTADEKPALPAGTQRTVEDIPGGRRITNTTR